MSENERLASGFPFAKVIVVLVSAFGIALGLCGLTALGGFSGHNALANALVPLAFIELAVMLLSAAGLVLTVGVWVVLSIIDSVKRN
jgi:hypothetical protein